MDSILQDSCYDRAKKIETDMEAVMFSLMNSQVPFLFADTNAIDVVIKSNPELFIVTQQTPTNQFKGKINALLKSGVKVAIMVDNDLDKENYADCVGVAFVDNVNALNGLLKEMGLLHASGDTEGVVTTWGENKVLVVNSTAKKKCITFDFSTLSAKEYISGKELPYENKDGKTGISIPEYAVVVLEK
jgi:hypothetical protein